jgi:triosephosphate isomerase
MKMKEIERELHYIMKMKERESANLGTRVLIGGSIHFSNNKRIYAA